MEDVKVREMQIFDFKKKIAEAETKLKQQQNLYEAVRSDRNLYSKNLIESQVTFHITTRIFPPTSGILTTSRMIINCFTSCLKKVEN